MSARARLFHRIPSPDLAGPFLVEIVDGDRQVVRVRDEDEARRVVAAAPHGRFVWITHGGECILWGVS
jgi:hypothetical protein